MFALDIGQQIYKQTRKYVYLHIVKNGEEHKKAVPGNETIIADMLLSAWLPIARRYSDNCTLCSLVVQKFDTRPKILQTLGKFLKYEYATWDLDYVENGILGDSTGGHFSDQPLIKLNSTSMNFEIEIEEPTSKNSVINVKGTYTVLVNPWILLTKPAIQSIVSGTFEAMEPTSISRVIVPLRGVLGVTHFAGWED